VKNAVGEVARIAMSEVANRAAVSAGAGQVVLFNLSGATYAMKIQVIEEVIELQELVDVPEADAWVAGTTLFRDRVLPVLDLRRRFGLATAEPSDDTRILVVSGGSGLAGFIVDAVLEVVDVSGVRLDPLGGVLSTGANHYLAGVLKLGERLVCLVDVDRLLPARPAEEA